MDPFGVGWLSPLMEEATVSSSSDESRRSGPWKVRPFEESGRETLLSGRGSESCSRPTQRNHERIRICVIASYVGEGDVRRSLWR